MAVVLTSFNRRSLTLECLRRLECSVVHSGVSTSIVLVDDGSSDGTAQAVAESFPRVTVLQGDGSLFWNRGMHLAIETAARAEFDFLLWLNDDTMLEDFGLATLLKHFREISPSLPRPPILVGATSDAKTGAQTYGGLVSVGALRRFTFKRTWSPTELVRCDAMNGNLVLIPKQVFDEVGNLDPIFEHALGDIDYALRARRAGFEIVGIPGFLGQCSNNPLVNTHRDPQLPFQQAWKRLLSRKGLPVRSWMHFTRRHAGAAWPLYFAWPYFKFLLSRMLGR